MTRRRKKNGLNSCLNGQRPHAALNQPLFCTQCTIDLMCAVLSAVECSVYHGRCSLPYASATTRRRRRSHRSDRQPACRKARLRWRPVCATPRECLWRKKQARRNRAQSPGATPQSILQYPFHLRMHIRRKCSLG